MRALCFGVLGLLGPLALSACAVHGRNVDPTNIEERGEPGQALLGQRWRFEVADRSSEPAPQEFASPALAYGRVFIGSRAGWLFALDEVRGELIWKSKVGSISSRPLVHLGRLFLGTDDGSLICLSTHDGEQLWRYETEGPILRPPVISEDLLIFSNEKDQVYALTLESGAFRWQYKGESAEEFGLRGHAGVMMTGDTVYTGLSSGNVVALRRDTGSVVWLASLRAGKERFVDVDTTPVMVGGHIYAASSAGGLYALASTTGQVLWRKEIPFVGGIAADNDLVYAVAADSGIYGIDRAGNTVWRQGAREGGEPGQPLLVDDLVVYNLSAGGVYFADRRTGKTLQFIDPGYGVSAEPLVDQDKLFIHSNSAILYAMRIERQ